MEDCREDWYGLWEIYANVAERVGSSPAAAWSTEVAADPAFGSDLRAELARMIDDGLIEAAVWWSGLPPRAFTASDMRNLDLSSEFWKSPALTDAEEQAHVAATDQGMKRP